MQDYPDKIEKPMFINFCHDYIETLTEVNMQDYPEEIGKKGKSPFVNFCPTTLTTQNVGRNV